MSDISKQQQAAVAAHQNPQQQSAAQQHPQMQQQVDGQTIQVQLTHDGSDQMHSQGNQTMQNLQSPPAMAPMHSQAGSTTITTMTAGPPQPMADWAGHGRVQVIQQPIPNPAYIQPVYNAQGQLIVPGNIALHPGAMSQPIQVITAGKPFQTGQMPHMLTTAQGKPLVQGQAASFPGYATIPTSAGNQTLVISQLGVLGQTNLLPPQQSKPQEMQKMMSKSNLNSSSSSNSSNSSNNSTMKSNQSQQQNVSIGNLVSSPAQGITTQAQAIIQPQIISPIQYTCNTQQPRTVPQGAAPTMQFAPWQATFGAAGLPQGLTWAPGAIQSPALLTQGSQIFIRNPQPEQAGMFIHNPQPSAIPQHNAQIPGQQINKPAQGIDVGTNVQNKAPIAKTFSTILPNSVGPQQIKSSAGVGTQTGQPQPGGVPQNNFQSIKMGPKIRAKSVCRMPTMAISQKADAANQTKPAVQLIQPKLVLSNVIAPQDPKLMKPGMQATTQTSQQSQQPLTQIQQMQNIFPEGMDQKPQPGQLMMSNGVGTGGDRVMPVVSMPPGQMAPIMGNMIVQTVPGIATMAPSITIPAGQAVQVSQEMLAAHSIPTGTPIKQESMDNKEGRSIQENGLSESRLTEENLSDESSVAPETLTEAKPGKNHVMDRLEEEKEKEEENKENKEVEKKPSEKDLGQQKATMMVKPQVLTHVIEGFVIQESSEPFPVNRGCMDGLIRKMPVGEGGENGEPPVKKSTAEGKERELATCEFCGKKDLRSKFKKSKRFCSLSCARREEEKTNSEENTEANESVVENASLVAEAAENQSSINQDNESKVNPLQWTVAEVCEFIRNLPGCSDYVEDFALQDIDGEALMLLKPDHLMSVMSMKLGPAVKIIAKIDTMRNGETNPAA